MKRITDEFGLAREQAAGVPTVRYGPLARGQVEPERSDPVSYRWEEMQDQEQDLLWAVQVDIDVLPVSEH
jgi:hypothetical protein